MEFFTTATILSLSGAVTFVRVVASVIMWASKGWSPRWFVLALSILASLLGAAIVQSKTPMGWSSWVVAVANGFLVCSTAVGLNVMTTAQTSRVDDTRGKTARILFTRW